MISNVREDFSWDNFTILHYHVFFSSMANNYGMDIENNTDYENTIFFENAKGKIVKYEAIFIDEIQDYKQEWIEIIKKYFLKENGEFVVFGDEKQNIYDRKLENKKPNTTIPGAWNLLKESFRLDSKIASLAEKFQNNFFINKYDIDTIEIKQKKQGAFDFETNIINIYKYTDIKNLLVAIFNIVKKHNIHSNDICILSYTIDILREVDYQIRHDYNEKTLTTFETQEVLSFLKKEYKDINFLKSEIENVRRVKKFGFRLNNGMIKLSTIHSFKGWETPTLFLIIDEEKLNTEVEEAIYVAITRARHNIIIFDLREGKYYEFFKNSIEGL
jgi:superfamily I DNA/RNA helicase